MQRSSLIAIVFLAILSFFALLFGGIEEGFVGIFVLFLTSLSVSFALVRIFKVRVFDFFTNTLPIFVIFLVADPSSSIILMILCLILSIVTKNIPFSLVLISLFGLKISWWAPNLNLFMFFLVIILGILRVIYFKKWHSVAAFILLVLLINVLTTFNIFFSLKQVFVSGFLFFSFFILPQKSLFYSLFVAASAIFLPKLGVSTDPLLSAVVAGDAVLIIMGKFKTLKI